MPQLDRLAYVSQVIWLIVLFFVMYLVLLRTGLPQIYKILRFRQDKLSLLSEGVVHSEKEFFFLSRNVKTLLLGVLGNVKPLGDSISKILESNLEERKVEERNKRLMSREVLNFNEADLVSDLVTCKLVDKNPYVKKGTIEKRIINN